MKLIRSLTILRFLILGLTCSKSHRRWTSDMSFARNTFRLSTLKLCIARTEHTKDSHAGLYRSARYYSSISTGWRTCACSSFSICVTRACVRWATPMLCTLAWRVVNWNSLWIERFVKFVRSYKIETDWKSNQGNYWRLLELTEVRRREMINWKTEVCNPTRKKDTRRLKKLN